MIEIVKIAAIETYPIRISVLRRGKTLVSCPFADDDLPSTAHFGLFFDTKLCGIVSVYKVNNTNFESTNQFQIRGMAVLDNFQQRGFGKSLMESAENHVKILNGDVVWMNARQKALSFYKKLGYHEVGLPFMIEDIGMHYLMKK